MIETYWFLYGVIVGGGIVGISTSFMILGDTLIKYYCCKKNKEIKGVEKNGQ